MTQQELAVRAGLSVSAIVQIESGRIPDPRISTIKAIAHALAVSFDSLMGEDVADLGLVAEINYTDEEIAEMKRKQREEGSRKRKGKKKGDSLF